MAASLALVACGDANEGAGDDASDDGSGGDENASNTTGAGGDTNGQGGDPNLSSTGGSTSSSTTTGGAPPSGPDLIADGWSVSYYVPSAGDPNVTICLNQLKDGTPNPVDQFASVTNIGNEDAAPYEVGLGIMNVSTLAESYCGSRMAIDGAQPPGTTATWEGPWCCSVNTENLPDGTYKLAVLPDIDDVVAELDEDNLSLSDGTLEVVTILGSCQGTPTSCSSRSQSSCDLGCSWGSDCNGSAQSCYSYFGYASCEQQEGCNYDGLYPNGDCEGSAYSCSSMDYEYECESQDGCNWDDSCSGSPYACSTFGTPAECSDQPGCGWY